MFVTRSQQQSRLRREALETWRAAAFLVVARWGRFPHADPEMQVFAFASYVAALALRATGCSRRPGGDCTAGSGVGNFHVDEHPRNSRPGRMKRTDTRRSFHASNRKPSNRSANRPRDTWGGGLRRTTCAHSRLAVIARSCPTG